MPVLKNNVIKSLTLLCLPERHQKFLEYQTTPDDKFPAYFDKDAKPMRMRISPCTSHLPPNI